MKTMFLLAGLALGTCVSGRVLAQTAATPASAVAISQAAADDPGHPRIPMVIWTPRSGNSLGLIVFSHGTGAGPTAHVDTAQALSNAGFVVVVPMHPGDNFQDESSVGKRQWFPDRSRHVSRVLDHMLRHWDGRSRLDPVRIGIFGFSAGATTALILADGELELSKVGEHCQKQPEFVCQIMAPTGSSQSAAEFTRDERIKAQVLAAPGLGFAFTPESLKNIRTPTQLWAGAADQTVPYATNAGVVRDLLGKNIEFHSVENAVHLSFLAPCSPESPQIICKDNPGFDRTAFHENFNRSIVEFFHAKLRAK